MLTFPTFSLYFVLLVAIVCTAVLPAAAQSHGELASPEKVIAENDLLDRGSTPADHSKTVRVFRDVPYGDTTGDVAKADRPGTSHSDPRGLCDIYVPKLESAADRSPIIVIIHGGGWAGGDKWVFENYGRALAQRGMAAVSINYRLAPANKFPAQADDVRQALLWVKQNAPKYRFDLDRLGLFGYSAGGHLSLLIASLADEDLATQAAASDWQPTDKRWQELPKIAAVCAGGPPCDFQTLPIDNTMLAYFLGGSRRQKASLYRSASPLAHVSKSDPATTIIHGDGDMIVPIAGARIFHAAQVAEGIDSQLVCLPKHGHFSTLLSGKTRNHVVEFFTKMFSDGDQPQVD